MYKRNTDYLDDKKTTATRVEENLGYILGRQKSEKVENFFTVLINANLGSEVLCFDKIRRVY